MHIARIDSVTDGLRPFWSVMIPAYNGAGYLSKTIESVLAQDPGPDHMQIEVIDDHSLKEDLRAVVEQSGAGRIGYYRQPSNVGAVENFNTCVRRSRGQWVHILHSDDTVLPGFYAKLGAAMRQQNVGAAFCRSVTMNEDDQWISIQPLEARRPGVIAGWLNRIAVVNPIRTPAMVVERRVYEEIGGYDDRLFHCADWDMWKRIAANFAVWFEPAVLACYREHSASDTSTLVQSGRNIEDMRRSIAMAQRYFPAADGPRLSREAYRRCADWAATTAGNLLRRRQLSGAWAQSREALRTSRSPVFCARVLGMLLHAGAALMLSKARNL
jgi:glycosyltransferase involved in cell wall biosynthesis